MLISDEKILDKIRRTVKETAPDAKVIYDLGIEQN
jgi:hypothetical protein